MTKYCIIQPFLLSTWIEYCISLLSLEIHYQFIHPYSIFWDRAHYVAWACLELEILLYPPPGYWDYRQAPLHLFFIRKFIYNMKYNTIQYNMLWLWNFAYVFKLPASLGSIVSTTFSLNLPSDSFNSYGNSCFCLVLVISFFKMFNSQVYSLKAKGQAWEKALNMVSQVFHIFLKDDVLWATWKLENAVSGHFCVITLAF